MLAAARESLCTTKTQHRNTHTHTHTQRAVKNTVPYLSFRNYHEEIYEEEKRDQIVCTSRLLLRRVLEAIIVTLMLTINWPKPHLISHQTARDYRKCIFSHSAWTLSRVLLNTEDYVINMRKPEWKYKCCTHCLFHYWLWQSNPNEFD